MTKTSDKSNKGVVCLLTISRHAKHNILYESFFIFFIIIIAISRKLHKYSLKKINDEEHFHYELDINKKKVKENG